MCLGSLHQGRLVADPPIVVRGTNFPPGVTVLLDVSAASGEASVRLSYQRRSAESSWEA